MLKLLQELFGTSYVNRMIGTGTNVSKPIKLDKNSPFKLYSDKAFDDPEVLQFIEKKLMEYGPYALSNKNISEVKNFEMNARRALEARKPKESQVKKAAEAMFGPLGKSDKPILKSEADVIDIKTGKKAEGIETLKDELGLPEEVSPNTKMGKNLQELKRLTKETELQGKDIEETLDKGLEDILKKELGKSGGLSANVLREGTRRPIIRQILAEDEEFRKMLSTEDYDDLLFGKDLDKGGDPNKDPLQYLNKFFERDIDQLDLLDDLIDTMPGSTPAEISAEFKKRTGGLKLKNKKTVEDFRDEGDFDPGGMAEGGRIGFAAGGIKALLEMFGKKGVKTADKIEQPDFAKLKKEFEAFNKRNRKLTDEEYEELVEEYGEGVPQLETVADAERFIKEQKDYEAAMFRDYKAGKLDPEPGEAGRESFLRKKMEEMEGSGDKRLMTLDELEELEAFDNRRNLNASGGLNYLMGL